MHKRDKFDDIAQIILYIIRFLLPLTTIKSSYYLDFNITNLVIYNNFSPSNSYLSTTNAQHELNPSLVK